MINTCIRFWDFCCLILLFVTRINNASHIDASYEDTSYTKLIAGNTEQLRQASLDFISLDKGNSQTQPK